jgi:hypothetical protein
MRSRELHEPSRYQKVLVELTFAWLWPERHAGSPSPAGGARKPELYCRPPVPGAGGLDLRQHEVDRGLWQPGNYGTHKRSMHRSPHAERCGARRHFPCHRRR